MIIRNGEIHCTDENLLGSTCSFTCHNGYRLRQSGSNDDRADQIISTCSRKTFEWSLEFPTCVKNVCLIDEEVFYQVILTYCFSLNELQCFQFILFITWILNLIHLDQYSAIFSIFYTQTFLNCYYFELKLKKSTKNHN